MRVGLTGGIGSGKSAVARFFGDWGAVIIDADVLAREAVAPGTSALAQIARLWPGVITDSGSLDRAALSRVVFADPAARAQLNAIVHPRVREAAETREAQAAPAAIVVHVVPLLFESDYWQTCAVNVLVTAPAATRIERVTARDGVRVDDVRARMAAQIDPADAERLADFTIANDADFVTLEGRSRAVYAALLARARA